MLIGFEYSITQTALLKRPRVVWKDTDWERKIPQKHNTIATGLDVAVLDTVTGTLSFPEITDWPTDVFTTSNCWILASRQTICELKDGNVSSLFSPTGTTLTDFNLSAQNLMFKAYKGWSEMQNNLNLANGKVTELTRTQVDMANPPRFYNPSRIPNIHDSHPYKGDYNTLNPIKDHFRSQHLGKPDKKNFYSSRNVKWGDCTTKHCTLRR